MNDKHYKLMAIIEHGAERAISRGTLSSSLSVSERTLRRIVHELRTNEGVPIISLLTGGYFLPNENPENGIREVQAYISSTERYTRTTNARLKAARRFMRELVLEKLIIEELPNFDK